MSLTLSDTLQTIAILGIIGAIVYGIIRGIFFILDIRNRRNEEQAALFNKIVSQLSSENRSLQLSAAILLRRFFDEKGKKGRKSLKDETINEISSLLRVLPTGIFQKTLGDGLAYAGDLSGADLQKTNLQDLYLGTKDGTINMEHADLFMSDLSYALIDNVVARNAQFYNAILFNTQIKNSDLSGANFTGADLKRVTIKNTYLKNACFRGAHNVPGAISEKLIDGIFCEDKPVTVTSDVNGKSVFFSMPGCMTKKDELVTKEYKRILESMGYDVIYYNTDKYPRYGQLNKVCHSIQAANAMVVFGLKQIKIGYGSYRSDTPQSKSIIDEWMSTPWNEIEVGMGIMAGLPILIVKDSMIKTGVFDDELNECFVASISTDQDSLTLEQNPDFKSWLSKF